MPTTDADRHRLHTTLERVLGDDDAATLMSNLPPTGWADVATKQDLDHLAEHMNDRFAVVDARFEAMDTKFEAKFEAMDHKFEASLQRALTEQTTRLIVAMVAITSLVWGLGEVVGR